jgi:hypothetical protein
MTVYRTNKTNWTIALGIPFLIFLSCFLITFSSKFKLNKEVLANGILIDLLVVAPVIYLLAIRKSDVPKLTVTRIFVLGLLFAGIILKSHSNLFLQFIKTWVSPIIEVFAIVFICSKFYSANKKAKEENKNKVDFLMYCRYIMFQVTGNEKFGNMVSSEIAVMYYTFFSTQDKSIDYKTKFTSYKDNGLPLVLGAILIIFFIETTGAHFLISLWSKTFAWILTGLSLYTCIQLFAHIRALKARPTIINADSFEVHNGLAGDAFVMLDNIERIELSNKKPIDRVSISITLLKNTEKHNIVVFLKNPIEVTKVFGIKRRTDSVLFYVDRPKDFLNSINTRLIINGC